MRNQQSKVIKLEKELERLLEFNAKDPRVFELMYLLYKSKLQSFFLYKTKYNIPKSKDLVHDTFIRVNQAIKRGLYKHENKPFSWIIRIANNLFIDLKRQEKRI